MNEPARPKYVPTRKPGSAAKDTSARPRSRGWNLRNPPDEERCTFVIRDGRRTKRCAKYRWSGGDPLPLCRNHNMEARELVRDEGRRGGRATASRSAEAKLLSTPVASTPIRTPADLMVNLRRIIRRLACGTMSPAIANSLLRGLEQERDRIVRYVDPDVVEGGRGFFRHIRMPTATADGAGETATPDVLACPLELDALNRPVEGMELAMVQRGLDEDAVRGRKLPPDWRGCVRRYLVEERTEVAYADETMRRIVGRYYYHVVDREQHQGVEVNRVFVPLQRAGRTDHNTNS